MSTKTEKAPKVEAKKEPKLKVENKVLDMGEGLTPKDDGPKLPYLIINGKTIKLVEKEVTNGTIRNMTLLCVYRTEGEYEKWMDNKPKKWNYANVDGVEYFLDDHSSVVIDSKSTGESFLFGASKKPKPKENVLFVTKSKVSLLSKPSGGCLVDDYTLSCCELISSYTLNGGFRCDRALTNVKLENSGLINTTLTAVNVSDTNIKNSEIYSGGYYGNNHITGCDVRSCYLRAPDHLRLDKLTLDRVNITANKIRIKLEHKYLTLGPIGLHTKETVNITDPFQIGKLANDSGYMKDITFYCSDQYKKRYSVVSPILGQGTDDGVIHIYPTMTKDEIRNKLRVLVNPRKEEGERRPWNMDANLNDLESSILDKMVAIIHTRMLVERMLELKKMI